MPKSVMLSSPTRLVDSRCSTAESPVWDEAAGRLMWCDIEGKTIHAVDAGGGGLTTWHFPGRVGAFGRCASGRLVLGMEDGIYLFDRSSGTLALLTKVSFAGPRSRLNDGKVGPDGAFWIGSMDERPEKEEVGELFRVTGDGTVERKLEGLKTSNGLAFGPDGRTMFHSDSRAAWIDRWQLDPNTGAIDGRSRIRQLSNEEGRPDGAACDMEGCYWSAGVSAGRLNRFAPDGTLLETIPVPTPSPTMPCFGGPDMKTLFFTSLRGNLSAEQLASHPDAGGVFVLRVGVAGVPVGRFRDA